MSEKTNFNGLVHSSTRRQLIAGAGIAFGGLALGSTGGWAEAAEEISHAAESIHQEPVFKASRKRGYEALTDNKQFDKVVQLSAAMKSGMAPGAKPTEIGRGVRVIGGLRHGKAPRAGAERANRPSMARGKLGSGRLLDCEISARGARGRNQNRV